MSNFNSMEAFGEWFDENIKSLEECEAEGVDIEYVMKEWCCKNNHDYNDYDDSRRIGVYNNSNDVYTCGMCKLIIDNSIGFCNCTNKNIKQNHEEWNNKHQYVDRDFSISGNCKKCDAKCETIDDTLCHYCYHHSLDDITECWCYECKLETKCGCEIIINSREHDECRCDDDGENWICSECYNGEYDEEENALGCCSECAEELVEGYWWSRPEKGLRFCADCGESVLKEEEEL
jgi:hypothetical protein